MLLSDRRSFKNRIIAHCREGRARVTCCGSIWKLCWPSWQLRRLLLTSSRQSNERGRTSNPKSWCTQWPRRVSKRTFRRSPNDITTRHLLPSRVSSNSEIFFRVLKFSHYYYVSSFSQKNKTEKITSNEAKTWKISFERAESKRRRRKMFEKLVFINQAESAD